MIRPSRPAASRRTLRGALALLACSCLAASAADAPLRLEPGKWRVKTSSTTKGIADPPQDEETCLRDDELKDLRQYFAPALEGVQAKCVTTRTPAASREIIAYRARCTGAGFTVEMRSSVTIASPERFRMTYRSDTRTATEAAIVVAESEAVRLGPCEKQ